MVNKPVTGSLQALHGRGIDASVRVWSVPPESNRSLSTLTSVFDVMLSRPIDQQMTAKKLQCEEEKIYPYPPPLVPMDASISELSLSALFRDLSCAE
jgi:hypothetical protein